MPRRSKRMWSIMPVSSGPCSSPGFMKPTNSQVPPQPFCLPIFLHVLSHPTLYGFSPRGRKGRPEPDSAVSPVLPAGLLLRSGQEAGRLLPPHSPGAQQHSGLDNGMTARIIKHLLCTEAGSPEYRLG